MDSLDPGKVQLVTDVIVAAAALGGVIIAGLGLHTWKSEMRGRDEYDLARRILTAVYKVRNVTRHVRESAMHSGEWRDRPGRNSTDSITNPIETDWEDTAYAYQRRLDGLRAELDRLDLALLEAEALWDDLLKRPSEEIQKCCRELAGAIRRYLRARMPNTRYTYSAEEMKSIEAIVWQDDEEDLFFTRVAAAVMDFESALEPYLRRKR